MTLKEKLQKLKDIGYNCSIVPGDNEITIHGICDKEFSPKNYFKAKKQKSILIVNTLKSQGFEAYSVLSYDGYYDFKVQ